MAVALIGGRRHVERGGDGRAERLEAAVVAAGLGDGVELALGLLDLLAWRGIDRRIVGRVDDIAADDDEVAPHREIVDRAAVILGIDDGGRFRREAREILADCEAAEISVGKVGLERDHRRDLARANKLAQHLVDAPVQVFREMLGLEKVGDAVEGVVVHENGAEQRLFRLDIVGRRAQSALGLGHDEATVGQLLDGGQGRLFSVLAIWACDTRRDGGRASLCHPARSASAENFRFARCPQTKKFYAIFARCSCLCEAAMRATNSMAATLISPQAMQARADRLKPQRSSP